MATIETPRTLAELDALYANLKAGLAPADEVVEQQHGKRFEDEILTTTSLCIPIWYNGEELGTFTLHGTRILGTRKTGKARYEAVRQQYAHVLAPKSKQSFAECCRGNRDADAALMALIAVLESMIQYAQYHVEFEQLPKGDDTWAERLLSTAFSVAGVVSKRWATKLRKDYSIKARLKDAIFTSRELCRVLSEVMRNELVFRMPTMADEIAWNESPEYVAACTPQPQPQAPYVIAWHYLAQLGKEQSGQYPLLLIPAAS